MEANEIMKNEEIVEVAEEAVTAGSGKSFKVVAGFGLGVIAGMLAYKYVVKPVAAKIKAEIEERKAKKADDLEVEVVDAE